MPRIARIVATEYLHHIVQRGNKFFEDKEDFKKYLSLLERYSTEKDVDILCLLSYVKPRTPASKAFRQRKAIQDEDKVDLDVTESRQD